ncbi:MAG: type 1 glutamine amidotransferase [Planctomycetota bacterium]
MAELRYLLLQVRDQDDPIREQEISCFASALDCDPAAIDCLDLLTERITAECLQSYDAVLIGGSGDYSAAGESDWLEQVLSDLRLLCQLGKPTFASCWGFQAIARALGGRCIHDPANAELGTIELTRTAVGAVDPLFSKLNASFPALAGHEDHVVELPPAAELLASSELVRNQAFKLRDSLIYCTQFHPELELPTFLQRVAAYPRYVEQIAGMTVESFATLCYDTPLARGLLRGFADLVKSSSH